MGRHDQEAPLDVFTHDARHFNGELTAFCRYHELTRPRQALECDLGEPLDGAPLSPSVPRPRGEGSATRENSAEPDQRDQPGGIDRLRAPDIAYVFGWRRYGPDRRSRGRDRRRLSECGPPRERHHRNGNGCTRPMDSSGWIAVHECLRPRLRKNRCKTGKYGALVFSSKVSIPSD